MSDAPSELAGYRIEEELGEGGMAHVYRAYDPRFDRYVALKILKPSELADPAVVARFLDEARNAGPLSHPNIVRVHRVDAQPQPFIDMELVEGPTLGVWLADHGGRIAWQEAARIARDLASALEHAHRLGRVHRDVKPGNILMADEGRTPKLVDFGIAMIDRPEATRLTRHGEMVGTPRYMSPEQVRGEAVDARTDLYSLGAVLYEMLAGGPAVGGDSLVAVTTRIVTELPVPLRQRARGVPSKLAAIVTKLMEKDRAARFASAGEARAALEACMKEQWPAERRGYRVPLVAGGAAVLAALGVLLWIVFVPLDVPFGPPAPVIAPPAPSGELPNQSTVATSAPQNRAPVSHDPDRQTAPSAPAEPPPPATPQVQLPQSAQEAIAGLYEDVRREPCARLETESTGVAVDVLVAAADPFPQSSIEERLRNVAGASLGFRFRALPAGSAACGVFDLINGATVPVAPRFLRLERPVDGVCDAVDRARCYGQLGDGRLAAGERLVVVVDPPPDGRYLLVDYFMTDGNVAHLYPPHPSDLEELPAASYLAPLPGAPVVIGDGRAGAADENEYPIQAPFGHELILAVSTVGPLFSGSRPFVEEAAPYLAALAAAISELATQVPAKASTVWVETADDRS